MDFLTLVRLPMERAFTFVPLILMIVILSALNPKVALLKAISLPRLDI